MSVCSFRCISDPVSALCGGWRHPLVLPGGGTWTVHVQRRNQCMEDMSHIPRLVREFGIKIVTITTHILVNVTQRNYVMLCYVMLCYVMLCYVMLSYAMLLHLQIWMIQVKLKFLKEVILGDLRNI